MIEVNYVIFQLLFILLLLFIFLLLLFTGQVCQCKVAHILLLNKKQMLS